MKFVPRNRRWWAPLVLALTLPIWIIVAAGLAYSEFLDSLDEDELGNEERSS